MKDSPTAVSFCTTVHFEGFIANIRPGGFATRFTGLEKRMPGLYALAVRGEIPPEIELEQEQAEFSQSVPRQSSPPGKRRRTSGASTRSNRSEPGSAPPSRDS